MTDWPVKTLGEVALVGAGNSAPQDKELFKGGIYRFVRTSDVGQVRIGRLGESADLLNDAGAEGLREFRAGVTLIPKSGASTFLNHRVQLTKPCFVSSHLAVVDSNPEVMDDTFMFYFLQTVRSQDLIQDQSYPSLNLPAISGINVLVPPLEEQKRIVALLDAATARVTELTACYEQARTHANNLFTSALRELMEKCDNTTEMTLSDICIVDWGNTDLTKKSYRSNGKYLAVSATGPDGRIGHAEHKAFTPVLSAIGARCGRMFLPEEDFTAIKNTITLTPIAEVASGKYIFFLFEHLSLPIRGAAQPFISKGDIEKFEVSVPPLEEQKRIVAQLDLMRAKTSEMVAAYDAKLTAAKNLRQSILEAAFAGDL